MRTKGIKKAVLASLAAGMVFLLSITASATVNRPAAAADSAEEQAKAKAVAYLKESIADQCPMATFETDEPIIEKASYTYENALVALALLSEGEYESAALVLDALTSGMKNDQEVKDRFRNAYMAGKATDLPGYWDNEKSQWIQDAYQVGATTKSNCAAALALLSYYQEKGNEDYLNTATKAIDWVISYCSDDNPGFISGYTGWINADKATKLTYKTTVDNLWMYVVCSRLDSITGWSKYAEAAETARQFVKETMYSSGDSRYFQGTTEDGTTPSRNLILVEPQALAALCLHDDSGLDNLIACLASDGGYSYDNSCTDGAWLEGTGMAALAFRQMGDEEAAEQLLSAMKKLQLPSGVFPQAGVKELNTGESDLKVKDWPSVAPCAWYILAVNGSNPLAAE